MRIKLQSLIFLPLALTACIPGNATPELPRGSPGQAGIDQNAVPVAANIPPTPTPIPFPSPTPTATWPPPPPTSTPTPASTSLKPQAEVIVAALNVRQGPGVNYPIIGAGLAGDRLKVTGVSPSGDWLQVVTSEGNPGWVSSQPTYVRLLAVKLADLPLVEPPLVPTAAPRRATTSNAAATNGLPGHLIFMTASGGDLYAVKADGTDLRRLTGAVIDPAVSPDGQQVAFTRWDGVESGALYTINLDGSGERAIVGDILQAKSPTWSPDGQQIVLSFQYGGLRNPQEECRKFDFDDTIRIPKDVGKITKNRVSADGISICFIRKENLEWSLRLINVTSGKFEDLPVDAYSYNPAWDPRQSWRVIYDGDKGLMQLDLTNGNLWPITTDLRDTGPVFSPDGQKLALTYKQHDHWEVYTLDLDPEPGQRHRLTKPPLLADPQYNSASPAWSPDGSHLAFVTDRRGRWEIWVMAADGSQQRPLFSADWPAQLALEYRGVNERMLNWIE